LNQTKLEFLFKKVCFGAGGCFFHDIWKKQVLPYIMIILVAYIYVRQEEDVYFIIMNVTAFAVSPV
jgi:hypothetical protein